MIVECLDSSKIQYVLQGRRYKVIEETKDEYKIQITSGICAWLPKEYFKKLD